MPSEEGKQVLQLLAEGKIDVEQAYRLLRALGDVEEGAPRPPLACKAMTHGDREGISICCQT